MPAKYTGGVSRIKAKLKFDNDYRLRRILEDTHRYSNAVTPMREGPLRAAVLKQVLNGVGTIEWFEPYAAYQERGMRADGSRPVRNYTTPGTHAHYAEESVKKAVKDAYIYFGDWL